MKRTLKRKLLWAGAIAAGLLFIGYFAIAWYVSGVFIDFSARSLEQDRVRHHITSPADFGLPEPEPVSVKSDGVTLAGWMFRNPSDKRCGVVVSHGHINTRYGSLPYATLFYRRGCHILVYDIRHHGDSKAEYGTYGYYERHDLVKLVDHFAAATGLARREIGLYGVSLGGSVSLQAAALMPDIGFVGADAPYADIRDIARVRGDAMYGALNSLLLPTVFWIAEWRSGADFEQASAKRDAPRIAAPVFLLHSSTDSYTPPRHSREIYDAVEHERKELHMTTWGEDHTASLKTNPDGYRSFIYGFLDRYAPGF